MNIIFEGINGAGKSTIIKEISRLSTSSEINIFDDINTGTICSSVIEQLFKESPMLHIKKDYDTAVGESLILLTDFNCLMQNNLKNGINIYDRFYFTTLIYQSYILRNYSKVSEEFLNLYEKLLKINAVSIDYFVYVDIDIKTGIERTEMRDKRKFNDEEIKFFTQMQKELKKYCIWHCNKNNIKLLMLDGKDSLQDNINKINNFVPELKLNNGDKLI